MDLRPYIFPEYINSIIEEKGNQYTAIRTVQWMNVDKNEEPNSERGKLEIRRWRVDENGQDIASKGVVFMTPEGPHNLTETMVNAGYGDTGNILRGIIQRPDFKPALEHINDTQTESFNGEYFDARSCFETAMNMARNEDGIDVTDF